MLYKKIKEQTKLNNKREAIHKCPNSTVGVIAGTFRADTTSDDPLLCGKIMEYYQVKIISSHSLPLSIFSSSSFCLFLLSFFDENN